MRILGGKWTASILWHLGQEPVRFNDLARLMAGASRKVIAERLRHLEQHGLILRKEVATAPPSVKYSVTVHGAAALESLEALRRWTEALPASADVEPEAGTSAQ